MSESEIFLSEKLLPAIQLFAIQSAPFSFSFAEKPNNVTELFVSKSE